MPLFSVKPVEPGVEPEAYRIASRDDLRPGDVLIESPARDISGFVMGEDRRSLRPPRSTDPWRAVARRERLRRIAVDDLLEELLEERAARPGGPPSILAYINAKRE